MRLIRTFLVVIAVGCAAVVSRWMAFHFHHRGVDFEFSDILTAPGLTHGTFMLFVVGGLIHALQQRESLPPPSDELRVPSAMTCIGFGLLVGIVLVGLRLVVQLLTLPKPHFNPDDAVGPAAVMVLTYYAMFGCRRRKLAILRRAEVIADCNHHIRNALYVLTLKAHVDGRDISEQVDRIAGVLSEILPKIHIE